MRLSDFILDRLPDLLNAWDRFAATLNPAAQGQSPGALRDHAEDLLRAIAADLRTTQSRAQQQDRAWGLRDLTPTATPTTAAELHAARRAAGGFSIEQLIAEFRSLRASVLRLYADAVPASATTVEDIGRFNEAVDQAVAESVHFFAARVEQWRQLFLGIVGHDLRGPLNAIVQSAQLADRLAAGAPQRDATQRLLRNARWMTTLLDDLLDYNRAALGVDMPIHRTACDLARACREEVELRRLAHPDHPIEWAVDGAAEGSWDALRVRQCLGNLISNAARHGAPGGAIRVALETHPNPVRILVTNDGPDIPAEALATLFDPLWHASRPDREDRSGMGLGLFVVREVARGHGGEVAVRSAQGTTTFTVTLPR